MSRPIALGLAVVTLSAALPLSAIAAEPSTTVGSRVSTPAGKVRVDTTPRTTTVRPNRPSGPSVTVTGDPRSREMPRGQAGLTAGYTWEF